MDIFVSMIWNRPLRGGGGGGRGLFAPTVSEEVFWKDGVEITLREHCNKYSTSTFREANASRHDGKIEASLPP